MNDEGFTYTVSGMLKEYKGSNPSVTIPEGVAEIGGRAFRGKPITSVHLPKAMKAIGSEAFYGCRSLSSINIPDSVTKIEEHAFAGTSFTSSAFPRL